VTLVSVLAIALLTVGVLAALLSCLGMLLVRDAYDRMHFAAPANTIAPVAIALAAVLRSGLGQAGIKALVVAAVLVSTNAALTHATARAAWVREHGRWTVAPDGVAPDGEDRPRAGEAGPA